MRRPALALLLIASGLAATSSALRAETCTHESFGQVVDSAGARLRVLTSETQPRVQARIRQLKEKRGWNGPDADDNVARVMADAQTAELDAKSAALLQRIDALSALGGGGSGTPDCSQLAELEAASLELQATVRAKSAVVIAHLEREIEGGTAPATPTATSTATPSIATSTPPPITSVTPWPTTTPPAAAPPAPTLEATPGAKPPTDAAAPEPAPPATPKATASAPPAKPALPQPSPQKSAPTREARAAPQAPAGPRASPGTDAPRPPDAWSTTTVEHPAPAIPAPAAPPPGPLASVAPPPPPPPMPHLEPSADGFSRDEIQLASKGFFGTLSGGLANVFEHAFSTLGRPSAYVLGQESGGALIAGVRYGKGVLFTRDGGRREVYWHGPSIGYDLGASGSKTMFLVYNLKAALDVFSGFSGVDGSAYLVGGVGMTLLTDGKVVMAPIRSGVGLRLGANIGYVRFTASPTWNPF